MPTCLLVVFSFFHRLHSLFLIFCCSTTATWWARFSRVHKTRPYTLQCVQVTVMTRVHQAVLLAVFVASSVRSLCLPVCSLYRCCVPAAGRHLHSTSGMAAAHTTKARSSSSRPRWISVRCTCTTFTAGDSTMRGARTTRMSMRGKYGRQTLPPQSTLSQWCIICQIYRKAMKTRRLVQEVDKKRIIFCRRAPIKLH